MPPRRLGASILGFCLVSSSVAGACSKTTSTVEAIEIDSQSQLLIDEHLIETTARVARELNRPIKFPGNPVMTADRPWEDGQVILQPGTVAFDGEDGIFKMWYEAPSTTPGRLPSSYLCYATSIDGIRWEKPALNVVEFRGSKANNIVMVSDGNVNNWLGHTVIKDQADRDPKRRYKLMYWGEPQPRAYGLCVSFSADGVNWTKHPDNPVIPRWATGDCGCVPLQDPSSGQFLLYHRTAHHGGETIRKISRLTSEDFINWKNDQLVLEPDLHDPPDTEFYGMSPFPYEGRYLGLLWVFHKYPQTMDAQLVYSRDSVRWIRAAQRRIFLELGYMVNLYDSRYGTRSFDSAMVFPTSAPVGRGSELWIYYCGLDRPHNIYENNRGSIGLAILRTGGFCSLEATSEGHVLTKPLRFQGNTMTVNARMNLSHGLYSPENLPNPDPQLNLLFSNNPKGHGYMRIEAQDETGVAIPGYEAGNCELLSGDAPELRVSWKGGRDVGAIAGRPVRFKFVMSNTKFYSFRIQ